MSRIPIVALLACMSCARYRPPADPDCAPSRLHRDAEGIIMDSTTIRGLVGDFRMIIVNTVKGVVQPIQYGQLRLALNDTLSRFYEQRLSAAARNGRVREGNRIVAGTLIRSGSWRDSVSLVERGLFAGCHGFCFDGSPNFFTVDRVSANGFEGRWSDPQTGNIHQVDKNGRRLPDPEGYFCVIRSAPTNDQ